MSPAGRAAFTTPDPAPQATGTTGTIWAAWPAWAVGLIAGLAYFLSSPSDGDFWWFDASRHAMNSVFVHDFLAQGGWRDPIVFAKAYYARYPGINIGFYPPFLYLVTAPVLGLFGVSHAACQAVVSASAALVAMAGYAWTRPALGRLGAAAAGLMLVLAPEMALWGRQVQLDVPAVALLLWGGWALAVWLEQPRARWLLLSALLLGCAMLTRVQTVFMWPLWLAMVALHPVARAQPWRARCLATVLYAVLSLPSVASAVYFARVVGSLAGQMPDMPPLLSWANWGWYAARFPEQLGLIGLAVLLLGGLLMLAAVPAWRPAKPLAAGRTGPAARSGAVAGVLRGRAGLALAIALLAWGFFSLVSNKEPRFSLPVLPFALLAALLVTGRRLSGDPAQVVQAVGAAQAVQAVQAAGAVQAVQVAQRARMAPMPSKDGGGPVQGHLGITGLQRLLRTALVPLLAAAMLLEAAAAGRWSDVPRVTGHQQAALLAARLAPAGSSVMISAHRDGNFIFALRTRGQRPDLAVRRADKLLVDMTIMRQLGIRDRGLDEDGIRALLARENVAVVVAQTGYLGDQPSMQALQRLLASSCCFVLEASVPIEGRHRADETELQVFVRRQ